LRTALRCPRRPTDGRQGRLPYSPTRRWIRDQCPLDGHILGVPIPGRGFRPDRTPSRPVHPAPEGSRSKVAEMNQRYPLTRTWSLMAICALLLFGPLSPERALAANGYTIVDLGFLPGTPSSGTSSARGINNAGVVVGISTPAPPPYPERFITVPSTHPVFRWQTA